MLAGLGFARWSLNLALHVGRERNCGHSQTQKYISVDSFLLFTFLSFVFIVLYWIRIRIHPKIIYIHHRNHTYILYLTGQAPAIDKIFH